MPSNSPLAPLPQSGSWRWPQTPLRVSIDRRSLESADGTPFFFFADTAWFSIYKGTPDQWESYLNKRVDQGFTVIQVQLLPFEWEALDPDGNHPFLDGDVTRPNEVYFARVDHFCQMAAERGLYVALFLIWMNGSQNQSSHFTTEQAAAFARYAVRRFGAYPVLWSISGDGPYIRELEKWEAVGRAVEETDPYRHPTTNHLLPDMNWHFLFHSSPWFDFHMIQTGHGRGSFPDIAAVPAAYYALPGHKPVVNGEPMYEGHPERKGGGEWAAEFTPEETRCAFWVSILSGATMGHTYGGQGVWNWKVDGDTDRSVGGPGTGPVWFEAIERDGAAHCGLGARLLRSLPWWRLQPTPERVQLDPPSNGPNGRAFCAMSDDTWVIYLPGAALDGPPGARHVIVKGLASHGQAQDWRAAWFNPRTGHQHDAGAVELPGNLRWRSPDAPSEEDWVMLLRR